MTSAHELSAFARVEPISLVRLNAAQSGIVSGLRVLPGERVAAGERLGALQGPEIDALLARRRGAVVAAQGELAAAVERVPSDGQGLDHVVSDRLRSHLSSRLVAV